MRMPPPGHRYVAATWIAVCAAFATVVVGTAAVLTVRDRLPDRIAVRWHDLDPTSTLDLATVLVLASLLVGGTCLSLLVVGFVVHRSFRGSFSAYAIGASVGIGVGVYTAVIAQTGGGTGPPSLAMVLGTSSGLGAGWVSAKWVRAAPSADTPDLAPPHTFDVPRDARIAWAGGMRMAWGPRLAGAIAPALPATAFIVWMGGPTYVLIVLIIAVLAGRCWITRPHQLAVDYSGIGLRGAGSNAPTPVPISQIRSASVGTVAALHDFGGWGRVWSADGAEGWVTRSGEALVVHRRGKPDLVFTVDGAAEAAAVLNTLLARSEVA